MITIIIPIWLVKTLVILITISICLQVVDIVLKRKLLKLRKDVDEAFVTIKRLGKKDDV